MYVNRYVYMNILCSYIYAYMPCLISVCVSAKVLVARRYVLYVFVRAYLYIYIYILKYICIYSYIMFLYICINVMSNLGM